MKVLSAIVLCATEFYVTYMKCTTVLNIETLFQAAYNNLTMQFLVKVNKVFLERLGRKVC